MGFIFNEMTIKLLETKEKHMIEIFELLQVISNFYPKQKEFKKIWSEFINQKQAFSIVAVETNFDNLDKKLVGFGSLHLSKKIRGGLIFITFLSGPSVLKRIPKNFILSTT